MSTRALVIGAIGAGCIAAVGVGGFVAQRMTPDQAAAESTPVAGPGQATAEFPAAPADDVAAIEPESDPAPTRTPEPPRRQTAPARPQADPAPPALVVPDEPRVVPPADTRPRPEGDPAAPPPLPPEPMGAPPIATASSAAVPMGGTELPPPPVPEQMATPPVEPPRVEDRRFVELTVEKDSVIGIRLEHDVSTDTARIEDRVTALVTRDVLVDGRTAIPAGARLEGNVALVERGGRFRERARLGVRFTRLVLSDDSVVRIQTETIYRDGESPTGEATSKIGASAVIGAILGGVIGGKKGAAIGGTAGAAGGTAAVATGGPNAATLAEGTPLTVRLTDPVVLLVERDDSGG